MQYKYTYIDWIQCLKLHPYSWSKGYFYCRKFERILTRITIENHYQILKYIPNIEHSNIVTDSISDFELAKDNQASSLMYAVFVVRIR